ncbi:hypothetical protein SAMN05428989_1604 [Pseudoxanthomonas sp. GM95]|uniref:hypothetical protein n=1 Tax=Pseudoxanthomonas sp. GM95 TaxID=1881043 RepID=UPI0008D742EC|nr:hypothetical protein [Pseudoxanthomonas sp. GM95]SEL17294.1 hypothetical protein SAMN05428989_1604 [Pseudoxanthomonas sp. GM95]
MSADDLFQTVGLLYQVLGLCASGKAPDPVVCEWLCKLLLARRDAEGVYALTEAGWRLLGELKSRFDA